MTDCISRDRLVDLVRAIDQPALPALDHLVSCEECRGDVVSIEQMREMMGAEEPLPAGFVDGVMHRIEASAGSASPSNAADPPPRTREGPARRGPRSRARSSLGAALVALLAGVAACVVLAAMTAGAPGVAFTPLSMFTGLLTGAGITAYQLTRPRSQLLDGL